MKHAKKILLSFLLCLLLTAATLSEQAWAASSYLSASASTLRPGNSFAVYVDVSGSGLLGIEGSFDYDSSVLSFGGAETALGGSWVSTVSGSNFTMYDGTQNSPINGSKTVLILYFTVKSSASPGSDMYVSVSGTATTASEGSSFGSTWSNDVSAPLSGDANLDDLWCNNADLDFTGSTEYSITVPYSVSSLSLDWDKSHGGASVSVSGNSLSVGSNTVTVTVTAENGNTKRYYLYVTREQDPNYIPSKDATLSALNVSKGQLSPAFSPDITEYVVYLPNEIGEIALSGTALDSKAFSVEQIGSGTLLEGNNLLSVKCTAEDQTTTKEYKVIVVRMPAYAGKLPEIISPDAEPVTPEPEPLFSLAVPPVVTLPVVGEVSTLSAGVTAGALILVIFLLLLLLFWLLGRRSGHKKAIRTLTAASAIQDDSTAVIGILPAQSAEEIPGEADVPTGAESPVETEEAPTEAEETPSAEENPADEAEAAETAEEQPDESAEDADSSAPSGEDTAEPAPSAEETPADDVPAEEPSAEAASADEEKAIDRMSLSELLDEIRGM